MFNSYRCTHLNKASADPTYTIQQIRTFSAFFSICAHIPNLKLYHLLEDWKYSDTYCEKILFQTYLLIDIFCIIDAAHSPQPFYLTSRCRTLHAGIVNRIPFSVICVPSYFFYCNTLRFFKSIFCVYFPRNNFSFYCFYTSINNRSIYIKTLIDRKICYSKMECSIRCF